MPIGMNILLNISSPHRQYHLIQITVGQERLVEFSSRLETLIGNYALRLQWLTSSSRRLFGVVIEQGVCFVLDCKQNDPVKFAQYRNCILKLLREQIARISSFNLIRFVIDMPLKLHSLVC
jgi:hypothetical protein